MELLSSDCPSKTWHGPLMEVVSSDCSRKAWRGLQDTQSDWRVDGEEDLCMSESP